MCVATTAAFAAALIGRYSGSAKPLMSLPTTAPAAYASRATSARQVSTDSGTSMRARSASMEGITRSNSSSRPTSGPGPAFTPPTSMMSAPSVTSSSASFREASMSKWRPWSKNESGVRLTMPMTRARVVMSYSRSPRQSRTPPTLTASHDNPSRVDAHVDRPDDDLACVSTGDVAGVDARKQRGDRRRGRPALFGHDEEIDRANARRVHGAEQLVRPGRIDDEHGGA